MGVLVTSTEINENGFDFRCTRASDVGKRQAQRCDSSQLSRQSV